MHRLTSFAAPVVAVLAAVALVAGCSSESKATKGETKIQQDSYSRLTAHQPAHGMTYSPTRTTINAWVDTWGKPGALAYVYLQNANGDIIGYYILKGPPVTSCAALTPVEHVNHNSDGNVVLKNPSVDGVYYSGGQCNEYYGIDASTGSLIDYTVGLGINVLLYSQPLPRQRTQNAQNLGPGGK
jgi:hypothetical protein